LAYNLIVIITLETVVGALIPQAQFSFTGYTKVMSRFPQFTLFLKEAGLLPFFSSWLFMGTMVLFFLNTLCCTIEQIQKAFYRQQGYLETANLRDIINTKLEGPDSITDVMQKNGFRVREIGDYLFAQKGLLGSWGVALFHLSLLMLILGVILTQAMKFEGKFIIAEGQTWSNQVDNYLGRNAGPWFRTWMRPEFQLHLEKFSAVYLQDDFPQQLTSRVNLIKPDNTVSQHIVQVVKPLRYKGFTIYQANHGYAPELIFVNPRGDTLLEAVISLNTNTNGGENYVDEIDVPNTGFRIHMRFLPDFRQDGPKKFSSRSWEPKNPGIVVLVRDVTDKILYQGPLLLGKEISFEGYTLKFPAYRHWSGFNAIFDPGYPVIFAGFILGTIGLIIMFYLDYQRIWVWWEEGEEGLVLHIRGKSMKKREEFKELYQAIVNEITEALDREGETGAAES